MQGIASHISGTAGRKPHQTSRKQVSILLISNGVPAGFGSAAGQIQRDDNGRIPLLRSFLLEAD
jgi:hypothetical protein